MFFFVMVLGFSRDGMCKTPYQNFKSSGSPGISNGFVAA